MEAKLPRCYQLVGVPGSGKTTWVNNQSWAANCAVISTDAWIEIIATKLGKTYSDIFDDFMPMAVDLMAQEVTLARDQNRDIIWDQTSTTVKSRSRKFAMLPNYEHIAVLFAIPEQTELERRLAQRPGKVIPKKVLDSMIDNFEAPTKEEGFKQIWYAN